MWVTLPMTTAIDGDPEQPGEQPPERNRVQSDSLRWVSRSIPPKTVWVQNRW